MLSFFESRARSRGGTRPLSRQSEPERRPTHVNNVLNPIVQKMNIAAVRLMPTPRLIRNFKEQTTLQRRQVLGQTSNIPESGQSRRFPEPVPLVPVDPYSRDYTLIQTIARELAQPLTPITGYLALLSTGKLGVLTDPQRRVISAALQASERLAGVIGNLVDFAQLETGAYVPVRERFELDSTVRACLAVLRAKANERRVSFNVLSAGPAAVLGDEPKIAQALTNIVDNAVKFSPHGGEVLIEIIQAKGELTLAVYDQGAGIPAAERERVFEPFFHADRGGDAPVGAGLGLPVARQIILAHGGRLWLESPPKTQPQSRHEFKGTKIAVALLIP